MVASSIFFEFKTPLELEMSDSMLLHSLTSSLVFCSALPSKLESPVSVNFVGLALAAGVRVRSSCLLWCSEWLFCVVCAVESAICWCEDEAISFFVSSLIIILLSASIPLVEWGEEEDSFSVENMEGRTLENEEKKPELERLTKDESEVGSDTGLEL